MQNYPSKNKVCEHCSARQLSMPTEMESSTRVASEAVRVQGIKPCVTKDASEPTTDADADANERMCAPTPANSVCEA